jgi:hypothetical protein
LEAIAMNKPEQIRAMAQVDWNAHWNALKFRQLGSKQLSSQEQKPFSWDWQSLSIPKTGEPFSKRKFGCISIEVGQSIFLWSDRND